MSDPISPEPRLAAVYDAFDDAFDDARDDLAPYVALAEQHGARAGLVSFRWTFVLEADGAVLTSDLTLRFGSGEELVDAVWSAGLVLGDVREAPDRPGAEYVVLARRPA